MLSSLKSNYLKNITFLLLFIISLNVQANLNDSIKQTIEALPFQMIANNQNLMIAKDSCKNTWIKGTFYKENLQKPLILRVSNAHLFNYELYIYHSGILHKVTPNLDSRNEPIKSRFPQYHIITDNQTYYLNLKKAQTKNTNITISKRSQFSTMEAMTLQRIGIYYGIAIMSIVFNFVFFLIFKDLRFISYSLLQISIFISLFYEDGMFYYISNGQWSMKYLLAWNVPITSMLATIFTVYFLEMKRLYKLYKLVFIYTFCFSILLSLLYTITDKLYIFNTIIVISFITPIFCLIVATTQFKTNIYARFILLSFGILLLFGIGYALYINVSSIQFSFFNIDTFRVVSAIELITISFAIIYKVKTIQEENQKYREEINKYLVILKQDSLTKKNSLYALSKSKREEQILDNLKINYNLTNRESEVLTYTWQGLTNQEIADNLFISVSTVKYHLGHLYTKLDIKNRKEAMWFKKGLKQKRPLK